LNGTVGSLNLADDLERGGQSNLREALEAGNPGLTWKLHLPGKRAVSCVGLMFATTFQGAEGNDM